MRSRWVRTPITLGKPWAWRTFRNSNVSWAKRAWCEDEEGIVREQIVTDHFEAQTGVNHEEDQVGNFADIDHRVEVVVAFNEC